MKTKTISPRVKYEEVSYYITSSHCKTNNSAYYISRITNDLLRKLIHIESQGKTNHFTNKSLSTITFLTLRQVEDSIAILKQKGFINCFYNLSSTNGKFQTARTITINWKFVEEAYSIIPEKVFNSVEEPEQEINPEKEPEQPTPPSTPPTPPALVKQSISPLQEITNQVHEYAIANGINPKHKTCVELIDLLWKKNQKAESIDLNTEISEALEKAFNKVIINPTL